MESSDPNLATHAVPQLLIFRQHGGSRLLMSIKSKIRNRLAAPGDDFRCAVSNVIPRIDQLVEKKNNCIFSLKLLLRFQSFFSFFQLWADTSLIKHCYCIFLSYSIIQMLVLRNIVRNRLMVRELKKFGKH